MIFQLAEERSGGGESSIISFLNVPEKAVKVILWYIDVAGRIRFLDH